MNAFLTGSQVYGTPRQDSDLDVCILVADPDICSAIAAVSDPGDGSMGSLVFGRLNLNLFCGEAQFRAWRDATDEMKMEKAAGRPVTRERAIVWIDRHLALNGTTRKLDPG